jgi:hypothetical protein
MKERKLSAAFAALVLLGLGTSASVTLTSRDAWAVIGRPLTPMSYAGVARRTARRTTRRNIYAGGYGYGYGYAGAAYGAGMITALPAGCAFAGGIYTCGAARYRPYYDGPTVVYQVVP